MVDEEPEHLDFDTNLESSKSSQDNDSASKSNSLKNKGEKSTNFSSNLSAFSWDNLKKFLSYAAGIIFLILLISQGSGGENSPNNSTEKSFEDNLIQRGEYLCSEYDANQADELQPQITRSQLNSEADRLDRDERELERLAQRIDRMNQTVDGYSPQYKIDEYNAMIEKYRRLQDKYNQSVRKYETDRTKYNRQIDRYNSYLEKNCERNY